jgi:SET domain-containing protein
MRDFQPNSFILEYRGEVISTEECEHRMVTMYAGRSNYYFLNIDADTILDAGRKGSEARFANHCCAPVFPPLFVLTLECQNRKMDGQGRTSNRRLRRETWDRSWRRDNLWYSSAKPILT